jgi:hypothetical protein
MKDVQVLLTQYFIMKSDETVIIYVSSSNKLKLFSQFVPENSVVVIPPSNLNLLLLLLLGK